MNNPDRRKQILDILEEEHDIKTVDLSARLGVTGATIRTDIRALEHEGAIVRYHGGIRLPAKSKRPNAGENYMVRSVTHVDLKKAIGKKAAELVRNGSTIFMDASSTTYHMIPYLKNCKDVTVVTNGIHTAMELQRYNCFKTIFIIGGMLRPHSGAIEGISSKEMIGRLSADIYFVSGNGFSVESGLTGNNFYELELKRMCAERARMIVALVDSTKVGQDSVSNFISTDDISCLVTDSGADKGVLEGLDKKGIKVIVAEV